MRNFRPLVLGAVLLSLAGCLDDTSDVSSTTAETALDAMTKPAETDLTCELIVKCKDGAEYISMGRNDADCAALEEKAQVFDREKCDVSFMKARLHR
jgi:hypothetical protein